MIIDTLSILGGLASLGLIVFIIMSFEKPECDCDS